MMERQWKPVPGLYELRESLRMVSRPFPDNQHWAHPMDTVGTFRPDICEYCAVLAGRIYYTTMPTHYNVRVILTEVRNENVAIKQSYPKPSTEEEKRYHTDILQLAVTEDTETRAIQSAINILTLRLPKESTE